MENMVSEAASSTPPESPSAALQGSSFLPESETLELSTTVDPSYIIHLIRQLLPPLHGKDVDRSRCLANTLEDGSKSIGLQIFCRKEEQDTSTRKDLDEIANNNEMFCDPSKVENRALDDRSANMDDISSKNSDVHDVVCKELDPVDLPAGGGRNSKSDSEEPHPVYIDRGCEDRPQQHSSLREESDHLHGALQQKDVEHESAGPTAGSGISEEQREEAGCVLWDLAASQSHAEFMVENRLLDVLLAILSVPHSDRIREICLGIMGNLACHAGPGKALVQTQGLPEKAVENLFVDDSPSLSEACRLLSAGLHSEEVDNWVKAIDSEEVLERIIWISANTMNSLLLEKSTELLLAMVDCQRDAASVLLSPLVHLGLPDLLVDLLACEITAINEGTSSHGDVVLDILLQIAEALSLADEYATQLAANQKLFSLACQVIRLSGRDEIGPAGISATVLVANLLAEEESLIHDISYDAVLIKQLLELLPSTGDDPGARNALWSIVGRLCSRYSTNSPEDFQGKSEVLLVLADRCELLLGDLQDHKDDEMEDSEENGSTRGFKAKLDTVGKILCMMERWAASHGPDVESDLQQTAKTACSLLKRHLRENELSAKSQHDVRFTSHENGFTDFEK